jgi:hypothetical protein
VPGSSGQDVQRLHNGETGLDEDQQLVVEHQELAGRQPTAEGGKEIERETLEASGRSDGKDHDPLPVQAVSGFRRILRLQPLLQDRAICFADSTNEGRHD